MNETLKTQRERVIRLKRELELEETRLRECVENCPHRWSPIVADHIYHEGYLIPGDPPGVGGSDHRCDCYVEAKTEKRWKRTCLSCGEVEYTSKVRKETVEHPEF